MAHRPLLPPRGIFITTPVLYRVRMRDYLRLTLIQLLGLAWGDHMTPTLSYTFLEEVLQKSRQRIYEQMVELRDKYSALCLQKVGTGTFYIIFADWLYDPNGVPPAQGGRKVKNVDFSEMDDHDHQQQQQQEEDDDYPPVAGVVDDDDSY
jgi:hypothetical protein